MVARQTSSAHVGIVAAAQRQRRQHHRGSPPLRPLPQSLGRLLRQVQSSARGHITGLLRVQREELSPDLDQIATRPEAPQRHPWVTAGDQHQLRAGSNLVDEKPENRAALLSRYDVHVVQYQHERVTPAELAGQERKGDLIDPGRPS